MILHFESVSRVGGEGEGGREGGKERGRERGRAEVELVTLPPVKSATVSLERSLL